jgi:hypothetical protein
MRCSERLAGERNRHLADFMRVEGLLQIGELLFRGHHCADVARIDVRIGGANDDFNGGVEFPDPRRGPDAVGAGRHPHVQKRHRERIVRGQRLAYGRDGGLGALAKHRREGGIAGRRASRQLILHGLAEEPFAQIVEHRGFAAHIGFGQDLPIGVAHPGFVVGDEHSNRQAFFIGHGQHILS